jgi:hypothetical protein
MVKDRDDLDKPFMGKGDDHVASSEAGMDTPIDRHYAQLLGEALGCRCQAIRLGGI